jgi:CDP-glycerol glycerophosphotransferase
MHVLIGGRLEIPAELRDVVRDVSSYPEIQELYLISDVLVTDYSSVFFDYASLGRPIVFYAYDLEKYRGTLRGFYLDYEKELPGPIVETEDDLLAALDDLDAVAAGFAERRQAFVERFAAMDDGHAAERVVDAVFGPSRSPTSPSPADEGR